MKNIISLPCGLFCAALAQNAGAQASRIDKLLSEQ